MNKGTIIAIVILAGYIGLEAYTIRAASQRMEPAYIHNLLVEAEAATEKCEASVLELRSRFARTLQRVTTSYKNELSESMPASSEQVITEQLARELASAREKVALEVDTKGCSHPDVKAHFQRYKIYATKSR